MSVKNYKDVMELKAKADALGFEISIGSKINLINGEVNIKCDEVYEARLILHGWQLCDRWYQTTVFSLEKEDDGRKEDNA